MDIKVFTHHNQIELNRKISEFFKEHPDLRMSDINYKSNIVSSKFGTQMMVTIAYENKDKKNNNHIA